MKASELIVKLVDLIKKNGADANVYLDTNPFSLVDIEDVDICPETDVIVIYAGDRLEDGETVAEPAFSLLAPGEMDARD
jgi:hypothetical protein